MSDWLTYSIAAYFFGAVLLVVAVLVSDAKYRGVYPNEPSLGAKILCACVVSLCWPALVAAAAVEFCNNRLRP